MIDLRSDTVTRPTEEMRDAAHYAEVGDDVYGEDPTVTDLERRAAEILDTEDALFCVSGTMANQVAVRTHTDPGQEVLCERNCHIYRWELAGVAQHSACQPRPIDGDGRGVVSAPQVQAGHVEASDHRPGTGLLTLENTHNAAGGTSHAPGTVARAADAAHDYDVPVHLDGARLWNAAVAHDEPLAAFTAAVDSVMCCLSKGLGAPMGSILAGAEAFIERAHRNRKLLGGGWRQAGIVAAPGLHALEARNRLAEDHRRAETLAEGLSAIPGLSVREPETNILLVETDAPAEDVLAACEEAGVLGVPFDEHVLRFCTHLDVDDQDVAAAVDAVETAVA
ncbi:MAG: low specificity L-threonine aldolase [Haloarculaceae archaeon]